MTVMIADPQKLDSKEKQMMYTGAFVEIYKWCNCGLVYETNKMVELEKYSNLRAKNLLNINAHWFYKITSILWSAYIVLRNNDSNIFYVNNYIDWD